MSPSREILDVGKDQQLIVASSEEMREIGDGEIHIAVTSPPYNIGKRYKADGYGEHDDSMKESDYLEFLGRVFGEVHRVLSGNGLFFLNISETAKTRGLTAKVVARVEGAGFSLLQEVIWVKSFFGWGHFSPSGGTRRLNRLWEPVFIFKKGKNYEFDPVAIGVPYTDKSNIGRYGDKDLRDPGDVWFVPYRETSSKTVKKGHEALFPIELPWRCIKLAGGKGPVLDPFAGTCSTLAAAAQLGLRGIGYDPFPPKEAIERRMALDFEPIPTVVLPEMRDALHELFLLLAGLQGRGKQEEIGRALARLPKATRERLSRVAKREGFFFEA